MKKLGLLVAGLITVFSMAFAQGNYFGVFSGDYAAIGVQYTMNDNLRLSVGLPLALGVVGSVDKIMARKRFNMGKNTDISWYYGFGAGALALIAGYQGMEVLAFGVNGHGLLGVEWVPTNSNLGIFAETQLGLGFYSLDGIGAPLPDIGGRIGVNFR